jgi:hypothetical protein
MSVSRGMTSHRVPESAVDRAARAAVVHQPGTDGWCAGCAAAGVLQFHPCPWVRWVLDGGAIDAGPAGYARAGAS